MEPVEEKTDKKEHATYVKTKYVKPKPKGYKEPKPPKPPKVSERTRKTFEFVANEGLPVKHAMVKAGFSPKYANNPQKVTKSLSWNFLLGTIDDRVILTRVMRILNSQDNRSALQAADMLLKLKDKYPAGKLKFSTYTDEMGDLIEPTGNTQVTNYLSQESGNANEQS